MNLPKKSNLYTIWNPKHNHRTIKKHKNILRDKELVKWLILYDKETEMEMKAEDTLTEKAIEIINEQTESLETVLFIQCLNIFQKELYVGRLTEIIKLPENEIFKFRTDPCIPKYYWDAISKYNLKVPYLIEISAMKAVSLEEILYLEPDPDFKSAKFNFPFPCLVEQKSRPDFFSYSGIDKFQRVIIEKSDKKKDTWYIKEPECYNSVEPMTLTKGEMLLIKVFKRKSSIKSKDLVYDLINAFTKAKGIDLPASLTDDNVGKRVAYLYTRISRINRKFSSLYDDNQLIEHDRDKGKYVIRTNLLQIN